MRIPFHRTLEEFSGKGFSKELSALIWVFLKFGKERLTFAYTPKSVIVPTNGYKMLIYPRRLGIHRELYLYGKRETGTTDFLLKSKVLREGDVVLDIGSNIGYYALLESKLVGNFGKVYAVEPVGDNISLLCDNLKLNNADNVSVFQFAFGAKDSVGKMFISNVCNWSTLNPKGAQFVVGTEDVKIKTVDSFLRGKRFPRLIRMDVEGYEHEILKGMPETLKKGVKLLIEVHTTLISDLDSFLELLERNGYIAKFAVFERKESYSKFMQMLSRHSGVPYSGVYTNISIRRLKELLESDENFPNVLFERCD